MTEERQQLAWARAAARLIQQLAWYRGWYSNNAGAEEHGERLLMLSDADLVELRDLAHTSYELDLQKQA